MPSILVSHPGPHSESETARLYNVTLLHVTVSRSFNALPPNSWEVGTARPRAVLIRTSSAVLWYLEVLVTRGSHETGIQSGPGGESTPVTCVAAIPYRPDSEASQTRARHGAEVSNSAAVSTAWIQSSSRWSLIARARSAHNRA